MMRDEKYKLLRLIEETICGKTPGDLRKWFDRMSVGIIRAMVPRWTANLRLETVAHRIRKMFYSIFLYLSPFSFLCVYSFPTSFVHKRSRLYQPTRTVTVLIKKHNITYTVVVKQTRIIWFTTQ